MRARTKRDPWRRGFVDKVASAMTLKDLVDGAIVACVVVSLTRGRGFDSGSNQFIAAIT